MSKLHIIYVPGLGDTKVTVQRWAFRWWRIYGVRPQLFHVNWANGEPFQPKLQSLLQLIDDITASGDRVSLVSASAGASAALNAFVARPEKIQRVACICGKIQRPEAVSPVLYQRNPAFQDSMQMLAASLAKLQPSDRARILSTHPLFDEMVPVPDTRLDGAIYQVLPSAFHLISIGYGLTLGSWRIARFLKKR
jgi:pimeloyl-ACP methyl ester carboxylesterase